VKVLKCPRTKVTIHHSGPIYRTEVITVVQCICANYVIWDSESGGLVDDF